MKKLITFLLLTLILIIGPKQTQVNADTPGIDIYSYVAEIELTDSGDMIIHEEWDMNYSDVYRVRFRDINFQKFPNDYPLPYSNGNVATFDESNYNVQIFKNDQNITDSVRIGTSFDRDRDELGQYITCEPQSLYCESLFVDALFADRLIGDIRFEYDYRINGAITKYSDIAELNWVLFEYAEAKIEEGHITIQLPPGYNSEDQQYYLFTDLIPNGTTSIADGIVTIDFTDLKSNDIVEFRLLMPTSLFPNMLSKNTYIDEDMNLHVILDFQERQATIERLKVIVNYVVIGLVILQLGIFTSVYLKMKRKWLNPYIITDNDTYNIEPPNDYPAAIINRLFTNNRQSSKDFTLTLLDLIERGYISVDESHLEDEDDPFDMDILLQKEALDSQNLPGDSQYDQSFDHTRYKKAEKNFYITFVLHKEKSTDDLMTYEKTLIRWLFEEIGTEGTVTTKQINQYQNIKGSSAHSKFKYATAFVYELTLEVNKKDFIEDNKESRSQMYKTLLFPIVTMAIILITSLFLAASYIPYAAIFLSIQILIFFNRISLNKRRTYVAEEIYQRYQTYKKQLSNTEYLKSLKITDVAYMDHLLVYSILFDFNEDILSDIENVFVDAHNNESAQDGFNQRSNYTRRRYYHRLYRYQILSTHISSSRFFMSSTSTGSSSGGYRGGGGGSFGGGGGGGRSR